MNSIEISGECVHLSTLRCDSRNRKKVIILSNIYNQMVPMYQGREIKGMEMALVCLETDSLLYNCTMYTLLETLIHLIKVDI